MKTLTHFAILIASILTLTAVPSWAVPQRLGAQDLADLQMKGASAEDHLKLAAHFEAETEALEQEAKTHIATAKRYNRPNLPPKIASLNKGMSRHCVNLSHALKEAAKEAEQLAKNHKAMAAEGAKQK